MTTLDIIMLGIFILSLLGYMLFLHKRKKQDRMENDLVEAMKTMSECIKNNEGLETAITKISLRKESAVSQMFTEILHEISAGMSFEQALDKRAQKSSSAFFKYFTYIVKIGSSTGEDISSMLDALSEKIWTLRHLEMELKTKTTIDIVIIQLAGIILMPLLFVFSSGAIGYTVDTISIIFLAVIAFLFSIVHYIIFNDRMHALIQVPLAMSLFYITIQFISPLIANFFVL